MRVVFVHGALAVDAEWWFHRMVPPLRASGLEVTAVELPSCRALSAGDTVSGTGATGTGVSGTGATGDGASGAGGGASDGGAGGLGVGGGASSGGLADLRDDVAAVRAAVEGTVVDGTVVDGAVVDGAGEPVVVCAHSYGGIVAAEAGGGAGHLVFVSSMLPEVGESLADLADPTAPSWLAPDGPGTLGLRPDLTDELVHAHFTQDCAPELARQARARLGRQSAVVFGQGVRAAAWREVPSTYVVCARDEATSPDRQRGYARRAGRVVELDTGHHPFLSRPELLAAVLVDAASRVR